MIATRLLLPVSSWLTIAMSASLPSATNMTADALEKRFFSVQPLRSDGRPNSDYAPWPVTGPDRAGRGVSAIHYCFYDDEAAHYADTVTAAVQLWQQAMYPHSSLWIALDPRCNGDPKRFCNQLQGRGWPLIIKAQGRGEDGRPLDPATTLGCNYRGTRSVMKFGGSYSSTAAKVVSMAHELGHAIGLQHEHQRPSVREGQQPQVRVYFTNLADYDTGLEHVHDVDFNGASDDEAKMDIVCADPNLAATYCPDAEEFVALQNDSDLVEGGPFDSRSIMNYGSFAGTGLRSGGALEDAAMVGVQWINGQDREYEIVQGTRPSAGDVGRVRALYPLCPA